MKQLFKLLPVVLLLLVASTTVAAEQKAAALENGVSVEQVMISEQSDIVLDVTLNQPQLVSPCFITESRQSAEFQVLAHSAFADDDVGEDFTLSTNQLKECNWLLMAKHDKQSRSENLLQTKTDRTKVIANSANRPIDSGEGIGDDIFYTIDSLS